MVTRAGAENRSDFGPLRDAVVGWYEAACSLRAQALEQFDLPAAPAAGRRPPVARAGDQRVQHPHAVGAVPALLRAPALFRSRSRPRSSTCSPSRGIRPLLPGAARRGSSSPCSGGQRAASCYPGARGGADAGPGDHPALMEVGRAARALAPARRAHPASVQDPCDPVALLASSPEGDERDTLSAWWRRRFLRFPRRRPWRADAAPRAVSGRIAAAPSCLRAGGPARWSWMAEAAWGGCRARRVLRALPR